MWQRLVLAIPIVLMPNVLHVPFDTGIPAVNIANLVLLVVAVMLLLTPRPASLPPAGFGILTLPLLLLFLSVAIGFVIAIATNTQTVVDDLILLKNFLFYPLFYFVYRNCKQDLAGTRQLIALTLVVAVLAGLEAVLEGMAMDSLSGYSDAKRVSGPFGGIRMANRAGVFFAIFLPMLVAIALFVRKRWLLQSLAIAGAAILALGILLTFSRQAYLIALVGLALLVLRRHLILAVLIAALSIPAFSLLPEGVTERVDSTQQVDDSGNVELDTSTGSRFEIWAGAVDMWKDHPAGVGLGRFKSQIGNYSIHQERDAHNMYVLMLAECGPLGLFALLWLIWRILKLATEVSRSASESDREAKALGLGFTVAVIAMAMGNLYGTPFNEGLVMASFWILCGLLEHYALLKRHEHVADAPPTTAAADPVLERFPLAARIAPGRYRASAK